MFDSSVTKFLYMRDGRYKWRMLDIPRSEQFCWKDFWIRHNLENIFELLERKFNISKKVCLTNNLQYHFHFSDGIKPFLVSIKCLEAAVLEGRDKTRNIYLDLCSQGVLQGLWKNNHGWTSILSHRINRPACLVNNMLFHINTGRLPTNKIISFKNLVVCYDGIEWANYRGKEKHHIVAKIINGQVLLPEEYQYMSETK